MMDQSDFDSVLTEVLWRCAPGRVCVIPPMLSGLLNLATTEEEANHAMAHIEMFLDRADLALVPLGNSAGHWVLLVLESTSPVVKVEDRPAAKHASQQAPEPIGAAMGSPKM